MTIHDDLETIPPEHRDQARSLLVHKAAIGVNPLEEDVITRRERRVRSFVNRWLIVGMIFTAIGIIGYIAKIEPTELPLVSSHIGLMIIVMVIIFQQISLYTAAQQRLNAHMMPHIIAGYDQLLDQLRAGRALTAEQIMDHDLQVLAALKTRPSREPLFIAGFVGVCGIVMLVIVVNTLVTP